LIRVWFILDSLGGGGAERSTAVLLPHLRERGVEVSLVLLAQSDEGSEAEVRAAGFPVHVLEGRRLPGRVRELHHMLRRERPDLLVTALYASDQVGRIAAIGAPTKVISSIVNVPRSHRPEPGVVPRWKLLPTEWFDRLTAYLLVDTFHAVTKGVARAAVESRRAPARKIIVAERGRDPSLLGVPSAERRMSARRALGFLGEDELVIALGRCERQKDFPTLLSAVKLLISERPGLTLLIAGRRGNDSDRVDAILRDDPALAGHVRLLGYRDDVGELLAAADVMALSSQFEGAAGVVLEAMQMRTPIVATALSGLEGILQDGHNCRTVPVMDSASMSEAIAEVLDSPEQAAHRAAVALLDFEETFTIDSAAHRMLEMFRSVVQHR
jgi:glycosyltransferase involved in cell wall biosynthesis